MRGLMLNLVEEMVKAEHGIAAWDDVIDTSLASGIYTSLGTYPDDELTMVVASVAELTGVSESTVRLEAGRQGMSTLARRYPEFFLRHTDVVSFLLTLNSVVHAEVQKFDPEADRLLFDYRPLEGGGLDLLYTSERGLCDLAEGLMIGAVAHYGRGEQVTHPECMRRGDPCCVLRVLRVLRLGPP
jgi:hypothetical protein